MASLVAGCMVGGQWKQNIVQLDLKNKSMAISFVVGKAVI